jgi:hypothetical protein
VLTASAKVADLVAAGVVLQSGGPYQTVGPSFLFTRLNDLKPDMIAEATARAREAAAKFAHDSGAKVGGIRRANQGVFQILARDRVANIDEQHQLDKVGRVVSTVPSPRGVASRRRDRALPWRSSYSGPSAAEPA